MLVAAAAGSVVGKGTADPARDVPLGREDWGAENAPGSPESKRDLRFMDVLERAFPGEAVSYGRLGGESWAEVIDVRCDRPRPRCQATGVIDEYDGHIGVHTCRTSRKPVPPPVQE